MEARLAVRTAEERANAVRGRADSLRRAAAAEREARRACPAGPRGARARGGGGRRGRRGRAAGSPTGSARWSAAASRNRDALAAERRAARGRDGRGARRGERAGRPDRHAHRVAAPRRGGQGAGGAAHRAARADGARAVRHGARRIWSPSTARRWRCRRRELEMAEYEQARERGEQVTAPAPMPFDRPTQERRAKTGRTRAGRAGPGQPAGAGGVRRAGGALQLPVHPARGRQGAPARTCSTSSPRSTTASCRCSPRPTPTWSASSARCSPRCSPAARAGCCSPIPTTC